MEIRDTFDHLCDGSSSLSRSQLYLLSDLSRDELSLLAERWPTIETSRRRQLMEALVQIAEVNFTVDFNAIFRLGLLDQDADVRAQSVDGLWEDRNPGLVDALLDLVVSDPSILVRAAAATGLGRFVLAAELEELEEETGDKVVQALRQVIEDRKEALEPRRRAVESISYSGAAGVEDLIAQAYHDSVEKMRISAIFSMGRSVDPVWGPAVLGELASANPEMRFEAARACGELELTEAVPNLISMIGDQDREVQQAAISALGKIGGQEARRALRLCCESEDEVIAAAGEEALGELELTAGLLISLLDEDE
ncbi:MAG: HEAT repeat domain-containing protein [Anaerolineae bacterium]|nr:HEAT repeat domain-containing protein [Anaerolineae bacterium]